MNKNIKQLMGAGEQEMSSFISIDDRDMSFDEGTIPETLPLLPLRNTVPFPGIIIPITVGRESSFVALEEGDGREQKYIAVIAQKDPNVERPQEKDLHRVGTVARILKIIDLPNNTTTAILQGLFRFTIDRVVAKYPFMEVALTRKIMKKVENSLDFNAHVITIKEKAKKIIDISPNIPSEALMMLKNFKEDKNLINFICSNLNIDTEEKQKLLEEDNPMRLAASVISLMDKEIKILQLKENIESKVRTDIEKQQRDYFLNQQLKTIQKELGDSPNDENINELEKRAKSMKWPERAKEEFKKQIQKVKRINPQVAEYSVTLNYLELMLDLPWDRITNDNFDLVKVKKQLDKDHFGLQKVKKRILEHLAVLKLKGDMKAPIIVLVGPPGVGKTSLGKSIASALNRKFVRMSLGGLHDESEIRGHRRTYIGAMPGRILQSLKKAGSSNPVFVLDEIDKVGNNFRGDPSSALLEVLDPEQNTTFHDNYLDIEYDLSKVLFIATANDINSIQPALRDRMEVISIAGYSTEEKIEIAKKYLVPKQRKEHGLKVKDITINVPAINAIIENYTKEAGVRSLNRYIGGVMRYVAKLVAMDEKYAPTIKVSQLNEILGPQKFDPSEYTESKVPGVAVGLAWTQVGGDILFIEASLSDGKGSLTLTGNLGDVMKESASTALSYLKANCKKYDIDPERFQKTNVHIHVPAGAIPKDGPSAGITMLTALASAFTEKKVVPSLAMTGEITLRGTVLPVGGIKEKVLAAQRAGIKNIIMSEKNKRHVDEIDKEYIDGLNITYIDEMSEVLKYALK